MYKTDIIQTKRFNGNLIAMLPCMAMIVFAILPINAGAFEYSDSAFGILGAHNTGLENISGPDSASREEYWEWVDDHLLTLGAHWTRFNCLLNWTKVEPNLGGGYDWDSAYCGADSVFSAVYEPPNQIEAVAVIYAIDEDGLRNPIDTEYLDAYTDFVKATAERYDGDGINDFDSNIKINNFQFINEVYHWYTTGSFNAEQYAQAAETTLNALREANPAAELILVAQAGVAFGLDSRLKDIVLECHNRGVEFKAVDLHMWGSSDEWYTDTVSEIRNYLDSLGLSDVEIWSLENGTYVGDPDDGSGNQTETDQARSLIKRYAWGRANGITRILWNNLLDFEDFYDDGSNTFWNNLGLIGDGKPVGEDPTATEEKRLSYWSYQLMAQYTDTLVAEQIGEMALTSGNLYGYEYKSLASGLPIYVIWHETASSNVVLPHTDLKVTVTGLITDSDGNTTEQTFEATDGPIILNVGQDPILVVVTESSAAYSPVADAGTDQTVEEGDTVTLDASNSTDPDDAIASYQWSQSSGTTITLSDATAVQPTFIAPDVGSDGEALTFQLTVTDISGNSSTDNVIINVSWVNQSPVADAGPDQTVEEGETVTLDASNSVDEDDGIASYSWARSSGPFVRIRNNNSAQASFRAPDVDSSGEAVTVQLTVTDTNGLQSTDTVIINITWINQSPEAEAGENQTVDEGKSVKLEASESSDPEGEELSYEWKQTSGESITLSNPNTASPTFVTPTIDNTGITLTFELTVTDSGGLMDSDQVSINVNDNGIEDYPDEVLAFTSASGSNLGIREVSGGNLTFLETVDPDDIPDTNNQPQNLIHGLINLNLKTTSPGDTAKVEVHLPSSAPEGYTWYKYDSENGWISYEENVSFNADRTILTITLVDGGMGDDDGTANGEIVDPSGLGTTPVLSSASGSPASGGGGGGGCFVAASMDGFLPATWFK